MATVFHSAHGSPSVDRFLASLRTSRLLSHQQIESIPDLETSSAQACAQRLVERGMLTSYQAEQLVRGDADHLILGQYRILEPLGAGGMGQVFRAEHQLMRRQVALKIMSTRLVSDEAACQRFHQEVQLVAQLRHPNIVMAYDADEDHGLHFFVMEFVSGADLEQIVQEYGPLPIPFACECIRQAALGLHHAHEHGLVHCDIKPSNLLLEQGMDAVYAYMGHRARKNPAPAPVIKILDFGLARLAGMNIAEPRAHDHSLQGTPDFMAPELARDASTTDIRCDLYSLGCTFSFLLTGQVPFPGGSWSEKLVRHHFDPAVSVSSVRPDVPVEIASIVARLMAKEPGDRFASAGDVATAIEAINHRDDDLAAPHFLQPPPTTDEPAEMDQEWPLPGPIRLIPRTAAWLLAVGIAVTFGLGLAFLVQAPIGLRALQHSQKSSGEAFALAAQTGHGFAQLDQAIDAAQDGDTILVRGNGPFIAGSISLHGKSLTIKADEGFQPRLDFVSLTTEASWEPLLFTDRPLTLEGLNLNYSAERLPRACGAIRNVIYSENSPLKIVRCRLTSNGAHDLIVCRQSPEVELRECTLDSRASALNIEIGPASACSVTLSGNHAETRDPQAALAVFWSNSPAQAALALHLEQNQLSGTRLLAFHGIDSSLAIRATGNTFLFQESLLCLHSTEKGKADSDRVRWEGDRNRFATAPVWATSNGVALPIRNLLEWRKSWNCGEAGSFEESMYSLPPVFSARK